MFDQGTLHPLVSKNVSHERILTQLNDKMDESKNSDLALLNSEIEVLFYKFFRVIFL